MGTNFYLLSGEHIGKRSAAGLYCWDCNITFCMDGPEGVHIDSRWYKKCPKCGKLPLEEDLSGSSAGRELGYNKSVPSKKTGVRSCSSFTWAVPPRIVFGSTRRKLRIENSIPGPLSKKKVIRDEYGHKYSLPDFINVLAECPMQFIDCIGQEFS